MLMFLQICKTRVAILFVDKRKFETEVFETF